MHGAAAVNVGTSSDINIVHTARDSISACTWDQEMPKTAANGFPSKFLTCKIPPGKVILAWCGCEDPLTYMYEVVKKVFDRLLSTNVIIKVEELCVEIKPHRKYVYEYEQGPQPEHSLYLVKTPDGNQYAVDLSGAQYGILDRPVIPWREYNDSYVEKVMNIRGQGYLLGRSGSSVTERVNQARDMDGAIQDWCEQTTLELGDLLTMATGAEFDSAREEICQLVREGVKNGSRKRMAEEETNAQ